MEKKKRRKPEIGCDVVKVIPIVKVVPVEPIMHVDKAEQTEPMEPKVDVEKKRNSCILC